MYRTLKISGCFLPKNRTLNSSKFYPNFLNYHATIDFYPYVFIRKRVMQGDFVHLSGKLENPFLSFLCLGFYFLIIAGNFLMLLERYKIFSQRYMILVITLQSECFQNWKSVFHTPLSFGKRCWVLGLVLTWLAWLLSHGISTGNKLYGTEFH